MKKVLFVLIAILSQVSLVNCQTNPTDFPVLKGPYLGQKPPERNPEIFAADIVSTSMVNHCSITISPDGTELYWAMSPLDTPPRIFFSRIVNGIWSKPEIVNFTLSEDGDCPMFSPDGKKMFFSSNRPLPNGNTRRERIWYVERINGVWNNPIHLGEVINKEHLHWTFSVDAKGNLYFGSERKGSKGKDDVFYAEYLNGAYKVPVSLGNEINTEAHEGCPFVAPDGKYLIFSRNGLWISFKGENGNWMKAISMGKKFDGICPYVSPDGKYIFFLKIGMRYDDIYWVSTKIIEELRPKN